MLNRITNSRTRLVYFLTLLIFCVPAIQAQSGAEANYKSKCADCHGADGTGGTPAGKALGAHDFHSKNVQKETDAEMADIISKGKNKMPKYAGKLKDDEIKDLAAYVRALGKK